MPSTEGLTRLSGQHKQDSSQIPRPAASATTTPNKTPVKTPSTKSDTVQFRIYQPPSSLRGWADGRDLEAPLRHLGLLDVARLQLPTGVPRPHLVSQLIDSYDQQTRRGYVWATRVNVDRRSFLSAVSLHPTAERKDLPRNVPWSAVTRAAEQFINLCLRVQWRDTLPAVSAAMREVKAGSADKVDWGKLLWDLVQNEILELPNRDEKISYFGVYLQSLIWVQHPHAFEIDAMIEAKVKAELVKLMGKIAVQFGMQPMEVQSSQQSIMLNDDGKRHVDDGCSDHMESQQRNQQKRARNDNSCGVPAGSAIAIANTSHDTAEIEPELKHATSDELREAETFIHAVELLQKELSSAETIMHMLE